MRILVFGTFDELHPGHLFFLREATKRGDITVVIARDENVIRIKGRAPVQDEGSRARAVQGILPEAMVILGNPKDFLAPVFAVQPDLILFGYDQHLPPGVTEADLPCQVQRMKAYRPEKYKSSLRRRKPV